MAVQAQNKRTKKAAGNGVASRLMACRAFDEVLRKQLTHEEAFDRHFSGLSDVDRRFAATLVLTGLRHRGIAQAVLRKLLAKPLPASAALVDAALVLGLVQLRVLEVAPHAVVHSMVELCREAGFAKQASMVNAVLQRVVREGDGLYAELDQDHAYWPQAWWDYLSPFYGDAAIRRVAQVQRQEPTLDVTVPASRKEWADKLNGEMLAVQTLRVKRQAVNELPGFQEGAWWVQDVASTIPVLLLGDVRRQAVLDLCAAPGGKTMQLAAAGAQVTAIDRSASRLRRLTENLARMRMKATVVEADLRQWQPQQAVDAILLDAPCSASGTMRRHPELLWQKLPEERGNLLTLQKDLLARACQWLKPRGRLVYSVCSLDPQEGESQIETLLKEQTGMGLVPLTATDWPELPEQVFMHGMVRILPDAWADKGGNDGFFAALLERTA